MTWVNVENIYEVKFRSGNLLKMEIKIDETYNYHVAGSCVFISIFLEISRPKLHLIIMFSIFTHVMLHDTHSEPGLPVDLIRNRQDITTSL